MELGFHTCHNKLSTASCVSSVVLCVFCLCAFFTQLLNVQLSQVTSRPCAQNNELRYAALNRIYSILYCLQYKYWRNGHTISQIQGK